MNANLPRAVPLYGFFALPRGLLLKVCADPCMYSPGYIQSLKPRWPSAALQATPPQAAQEDGRVSPAPAGTKEGNKQ